jgi:hypothetical protein
MLPNFSRFRAPAASILDAAEQRVIRALIDIHGSGAALRRIVAAVAERGDRLMNQMMQARAEAA